MSVLMGGVDANINVKSNPEKYNLKLGIHRWKRYPEYKDSGVEWIGEIPKEWNIKPLKKVTKFISRGNGPDYVDQSSVKVINQACIYWDGLNLGNLKYQRETNVLKWKGLLQKGDLLLNSTGTGTLGRSSVFNQNGTFIADSHVTIVRSIENSMLAGYLLYLIQTPLYQGFIYSALVSGSTNQIELSREGLRSTPIIIPSIPEQKLTITFLDRETSKIDALVQKKQHFVELLEEKRSALISHAVTKGLEPNVKVKDSGVEWIGEIPDHWKVKPFKRLTTRVDVGIAEAATHAYRDEGIPIIRSNNIRPNKLLLDDIYFIQKWFAEKNTSKYLHSGDIVTVRTGNAGVSAVIPPSLHMSQCFTLLISTLYFNQIPQFYCYYLNSQPGRTEFQIKGWGTAQINISVPILQNLPVPEPPFDEQIKIVNFLDHETGKIDTLINKISVQIEKLKEYRTALISAAVTGKIDVREEVA